MIELPAGPFEVVTADPPWNFKGNSQAKPGRNARRHYPTMSLEEIAAMPVRDVVAKEAILFLWITTPFLVVGAHLPIMKAWGFKPSSSGFVWVKTNGGTKKLFLTPKDFWIGTGLTTRKNVEICLIGKRGRSLRVDGGVPELLVSPRRKEHSRKPDEFFSLVERYAGPRTRLELFSREDRPGWTCWGQEAGKFNV